MTAITVKINGSEHGPIEVRDDLSMNDFLREVLGMTPGSFRRLAKCNARAERVTESTIDATR